MGIYPGNQVYGIRWWIENAEYYSTKHPIYETRYDSVMTEQQIQDAKTEFEKLFTEDLENVIIQVYVDLTYSYDYPPTTSREWWRVNTEQLLLFFNKTGCWR